MHQASVQVRGKGIAQDSKKNEKIVKAKLRANPEQQRAAEIINISMPVKVERTDQYIERWEKHQRKMKVT